MFGFSYCFVLALPANTGRGGVRKLESNAFILGAKLLANFSLAI